MPGEAIGLLAVYLLVLFLPGGAVAAAAGLRWPVAIAVAPLLTYGFATATGTVAGYVDLTWGPLLLAVEAVALAGIVLLVRTRRTGRARHRERHADDERGRTVARRGGLAPTDLLVGGGVAAGALLSAFVIDRGFAGLGRPNQDWDYTFHANATRLIADTGDVAPAALRAVNDWESDTYFYPNAYHAIAAVVRDATGASVFEVLNAQTLLLAGITGLGLAVLLREMRAPTVVVAVTPLLLAGFTSFPYDTIWRGPLLPYATGLSLTPAFLLLVWAVCDRPGFGRAALASLGGAGLLGLQPATALSGAFLALLFVGFRWVVRRGVPSRELLMLLAAGAFTLVLALPDVLGAISTGGSQAAAQVDWPAVQTPGQAVGDLLFLDHNRRVPQLTLALLVIVGLFSLASAAYMWWWLTGAGVAGLLFVLAASLDDDFTQAVTGPWWNDRYRFAALAVLGLAPLAGHGLWRLSLGLAHLAGKTRRLTAGRRPALVQAVCAMAVLTAVLVLSGGLYVQPNSKRVATAYQTERYLNGAEVAAMAWLGERVQPGETVMNDPGDGSAYMSALDGVRPLFGHQVPQASYSSLGPTQRALFDRFRCLDTDPEVRQAVESLDIRYVFLSTGYVRKNVNRIQGLQGVEASASLRQVYDQGGVQIYEVDLQPVAERPLDGCPPASGTSPG
ncbi:hypothetical protein GB931_20925 [Modestobacter sp. I12A-02628]|uniref:Uncharacterized protein n=1 Tax=Goekera deserti TaxID=2497753 RepID=A0A7K3W8D6_9ACTN|nr:DUF6541 family protein [Goekera deserti]MPR00338.1 hypothetical protein [Goekera deserti]NDI49512.1 hypothetical protein [Goekera deserti]NEL52614.1 hypothetical protein [Goekera deserti]